MTPYRIITGPCLAALASIESGSISCCVTSPPYWGLRDYGHPDQLGLEATPNLYVAGLVEVFREVRRVLADDGTLWLNLGDTYAQGGRGGVGDTSTLQGARHNQNESRVALAGAGGRLLPAGLKAKDMVGIPWRVAFALQADGWWLRSDIVWSKSNAMPESVTDRPTKAHEYVFLLSKSEVYFYDAAAIAEASSSAASGNKLRKYRADNGGVASDINRSHQGFAFPWEGTTRNARSVWDIQSRPFADAHFAVMPEELARRCIVAGSRRGGVVLDPFSGAGTTGVAATKNGRFYVGCELNPEYVAMSERRLAIECPGLLFTGTEARP